MLALLYTPAAIIVAAREFEIAAADIFGGRRVVLFALPGAFTPTCSETHLPRYEELHDDFIALGVDEVICLSVNDAFVMFRWAQHEGVEKVTMLSDGSAAFTRRMGMLVSKQSRLRDALMALFRLRRRQRDRQDVRRARLRRRVSGRPVRGLGRRYHAGLAARLSRRPGGPGAAGSGGLNRENGCGASYTGILPKFGLRFSLSAARPSCASGPSQARNS